MNRSEQEYYRNIEKIAKSLERIAVALESNKKSGLGNRGIQMVSKANRVKHI